MSKTEQLLSQSKAALDQLQTPPELENRLRTALQLSVAKKKRKQKLLVRALVACLALFLIIGFNFETLAYFSKKIVNYDQVMNGTLQRLNELGKGQLIGKSYTFKNGVRVTLDGVMVDDTQLLAYFTVKDTQGQLADLDLGLNGLYLQGLLEQYRGQSGQGFYDEKKKEIRWQYSFEPPRFYERKLLLKFSLQQDGRTEEGEIAFDLDRSKAVGKTVRIRLNESVIAHHEQIKLVSLLASPTQTILEGSVRSPWAEVMDYLRRERIRLKDLEIKLLANGEEVAELGGRIGTNINGITFQKNYDALPQDLNSLQIVIESFSAEHEVGKKVPLEKDMAAKSIEINDQKISLDKVEVTAEGNTQLTITSVEGIVLSKVKLSVDGKLVSLEKTVNDSYEKTFTGEIHHTRTLVFPAQGADLELLIERISYPERVNQVVEVPVN